jgi:hypothetical protein
MHRRFCRRSRAKTFSGPFVPEVTEGVFPGHEVVDRTSINAWLTPNFVKAVEATQAEGFQGVHFSQNPERANRE